MFSNGPPQCYQPLLSFTDVTDLAGIFLSLTEVRPPWVFAFSDAHPPRLPPVPLSLNLSDLSRRNRALTRATFDTDRVRFGIVI